MDDYVIDSDDPRSPDILALLDAHLAFANEHSPREDVHALDLSGLLSDDITFYSIRENGRLLGVGALKQLDREHFELKSVHTAAAVRGRGIGRAIVDHLIEQARDRGCRRVSLETGSMEAFAPSRALYRAAGFEPCEPFGQYGPSPNSVCMTRLVD